jgi:hypothetical protein
VATVVGVAGEMARGGEDLEFLVGSRRRGDGTGVAAAGSSGRSACWWLALWMMGARRCVDRRCIR